jgi:hypothetical protein
MCNQVWNVVAKFEYPAGEPLVLTAMFENSVGYRSTLGKCTATQNIQSPPPGRDRVGGRGVGVGRGGVRRGGLRRGGVSLGGVRVRLCVRASASSASVSLRRVPVSACLCVCVLFVVG